MPPARLTTTPATTSSVRLRMKLDVMLRRARSRRCRPAIRYALKYTKNSG